VCDCGCECVGPTLWVCGSQVVGVCDCGCVWGGGGGGVVSVACMCVCVCVLLRRYDCL